MLTQLVSNLVSHMAKAPVVNLSVTPSDRIERESLGHER